MIIVLKSGATDVEVEDVCHRITSMGYSPHTIRGALRTVIGAVGDDRGKEALRSLESLECVESVTPILKPYKLASREVRDEPTEVRVGDVTIGGTQIVVMAGPCAIESRLQLLDAAEKVKAAGARVLRGGAFKPRTSPYAFQGLEDEGLKLLAEAKRETGLPIVTEVMEPDKVELVAEYADILQVGARNVQNFSLLRRVGEAGKPVLLKRGMATTIQEWLLNRRGHASLEEHRLPRFADAPEQREVLNVARADLEDVGVLGDQLDLVGLHDLGDDRQPGLALRFGQQLQSLVLEPLEGVRRGARLERAAAEDARAGGLHFLRGVEQLQPRLDRARAGHDDDPCSADRHVADTDLGRLVAHLTARQLVGLEDRRDRLDAFERLEAAQRLLAAIVAHRTDHGA